MIIGLFKETKEHEYRVALTPHNVGALVRQGHRVLVQSGAGEGIGFSNAAFEAAGAKLIDSAEDLIRNSELILKVKEPTLEEIDCMRSGQMVFSYLHLAAVPHILKKLLEKKVTALGYETLQLKNGFLPLLAPMSEIAGKLATQNGAHLLRSDQGGRGVLLGGTTTVSPAHVVVLGAGTVGENAATLAVGMGAMTHIVDLHRSRLNNVKKKLGVCSHVYPSNSRTIARLSTLADLLVGAVLIPGAKAPKLVTEGMVKTMKKGSVIIDVAVDQGGCVETSEVTSHSKPVVIKYGVLHYGVPNIPAVVPLTATLALTRATFPYISRLVRYGLEKAAKKYPEMQKAVNCLEGKIVHPALQVLSS